MFIYTSWRGMAIGSIELVSVIVVSVIMFGAKDLPGFLEEVGQVVALLKKGVAEFVAAASGERGDNDKSYDVKTINSLDRTYAEEHIHEEDGEYFSSPVELPSCDYDTEEKRQLSINSTMNSSDSKTCATD